jgi:ribosomal protein S18 acetylase RimI-like enzyme
VAPARPSRRVGRLTTATREQRALELHHQLHAKLCDVHEPWAHGTVVRATKLPKYYDMNVVRVESDPGMSAHELIAFADEALAGLEHRRIDFEDAALGESLRPGFEQEGWLTERLVWMLHEAPPPPGPELAVEEVPYDEVHELRVAWHFEDFPDLDPSAYLEQARSIAPLLRTRVLAVREAGRPVAYAQLDRLGDAAEIAQVYVHPEHRGAGLGTAVTRAAIEAAGDPDELLIVADDEGRPKALYGRLGFRPAWVAFEMLRLP